MAFGWLLRYIWVNFFIKEFSFFVEGSGDLR